MNRGVIICVDDENVVLQGLKSQLDREFGEDYDLEMCESGQEALEVLNDSISDGDEVLVVVTDQIMPGMKGNDFLRQVHQQSPTTCNIMLTGRADSGAIGDAVNNANLYRYFNKPWESENLIHTIREAILKLETEKLISSQIETLSKRKAELMLSIDEQSFELKREREKINSLLLNILPSKIVDEMNSTGGSIPTQFEKVSVLFTDFTNFNEMSAEISATELLADLNECFIAFDEIADRHNMEKIKTIGDVYMCAGGIPTKNISNPVDAVYTALAIKNWVRDWNESRVESNKTPWEIRIGVHTGDVIAGVIGKKKIQYDLWGDAVNIASRMVSHGETGAINISEQTYDQVKENFTCVSSSLKEIKNRGQIKMYTVEDVK